MSKKKIFWRYDLPTELTAELERKADLQETCTITINLLELLGLVVSAWVMLELVGDRSDAAGDPILMRCIVGVPKRWGHRKKELPTYEKAGAP